MNKEVSFKINQLLYDKGWRYELGVNETGHKVKNSLAEQRWNEGDLTYVDITTAQVIDWLYEKHGIFVQPFPIGEDGKMKFYSKIIINDNGWIKIKQQMSTIFNSPTEAYEAAIEYTLNELI